MPASLGGPPPQPRPRLLKLRLGPLPGALLVALLAALAQWATLPWLGGRMPFVFVLPAVVLSAAVWGRCAGTVTLGLAVLGSAPLLLRPAIGPVPGGPLLLPLLLLGGIGGLLVELGARLRRLRQRARAAEARLMHAIEGTGMGVFEIDLLAQQVHLSPGLARHLGQPPGPLPLQRWLDALPAPLLQAARQQLRTQTQQRVGSYEQTLHLPPASGDGRIEWLLLRMQIDWDGTRPTQLRGVCIDITARKQAEDALAGARQALQRRVDDLDLLHQLSSQLLDVDQLDEQLGVILRKLVEVHGARCGMVALLAADGSRLEEAAATGLDAALRGRLLAALAAPEARMMARQPAAPDATPARAGGERLAGRVVLDDTEAGTTPPAWRALAREAGVRAVHATPLVSRGGVLLGVVVVLPPQPGRPGERECLLADICARKAAVFVERARARAALAAEKDRFQAVLESSAVPFAVLAPLRDAQGRVADFRWRYVNGAAARTLDLPARALLGRRVVRGLRGRSGATDALQPCIDVVEQGRAQQMEVRLQLHGREGWVQCIASPLQGEVAVWFNDITDRKHDEQVLRESARRKDEFIAMLAHELRNPLAPIRQAALLLRAPGVGEAQARWCHDVIARQVQHLAELLDDLLDVARITRGHLTLRRDAVWLQGVVDAALETVRPLVDARGHRLTVVLPPQPLRLHADPLRLSQVLANLLANAARYTGRGGTIELRGEVGATGLRLSVSDNGIGIPPESLGRVFEMFSQLAQPGERAQGGLGIGLALSRALVELHGGRLEAHSEGPGRGSRFSVLLPGTVLLPAEGPAPAEARDGAEVGEAATATGPVAVPAARLPAAAPPPAPGGLRLLVADDNRDAAGSLAMLLQLHGHVVHQAHDGEQALAVAERFAPQVCLLDIGMPRRDGYSVARAIRRMPGRQPLLIAVTGWGQAHDRQRALDAGFDHHLTKPVAIDQLLELVAVAAVPAAPAG